MADKKLFTPLSGTQRIFEAVLIAITLMAAYLLLALLTYHPADPGWSQTSWQGEVKNLAGSAGAWLADITMFTTDTCPYCEQARQWLNHHQATWQECNIDQSQACQRLFQARGSPGVPLLHVNGLWRLGFDPVWLAEALQSSPKTDKSPRP